MVAEGVDPGEQRAQLLRFGSECCQGYLYSKALPIDELERLIKKQAIKRA